MRTLLLSFIFSTPVLSLAQENCEGPVNALLRKWDSKATFSSPDSLTKDSGKYEEPRIQAKTGHFNPLDDIKPDEVVIFQKGDQEEQSVFVYLKNKKIVAFTQLVSNFEKFIPKRQLNKDLPAPKYRTLTTELDANCQLAKASLGHEGLLLASRFQTSMTGQECLDPKTSATAYYKQEVKRLKEADEAETKYFFERRSGKSPFEELAERAYVDLDDPAEVKEFRAQQEKRVRKYHAKIFGDAIKDAGLFKELKISLCGLYAKEMLPPLKEDSKKDEKTTSGKR